MYNRNQLLRGLLLLTLLVNLLAFLPADAAVEQPGDAAPWDPRFGMPGVEGRVTATAVAANGDIFVGGDFTKAGGIVANHIARWDGSRWYSLGDGLNGAPRALVVDGGDLYVGGDFTTAGAASANRIARWDGTAWAPVGTGEGTADDFSGQGYIHAMTIMDGALYIGGDFVAVDGVSANNIARWDGANWSAVDQGIGQRNWEGNFEPVGEVRVLLAVGNTLVVGGRFGMAGTLDVSSIAAWDGVGWSDIGGGFTKPDGNNNPEPGVVMGLAIGNNTLYAGGWFNRAGGANANNVAAWDGSSWSALGAGVRTPQFAGDPPVNALAFTGGMLYAAGRFDAAGNQNIGLLAAWNGTSWSSVGGGVSNDGYDVLHTLAVAPDGTVVLGGAYRIVGNQRVDNVAQWNGTTWQALGRGLLRIEWGDLPAKPNAIAVDEEGRVFVGGEFIVAGGRRVKNLAMWDGAQWNDIGGTDARVRALALGDEYLYVAGEFTQAGGVAASHVAAWNRTTGQWSALGTGINGHVHALAYSDGILYAGGAFTAAGGGTALDVAYWDGAAWHPFGNKARIFEVGNQGGEVGTFVNALAVAGDRVFVGGHFQTVQFGTNTTDLSSFLVVHNVVEWDSANDQWFYLGDAAKRGVTIDGFSGFSVDVYALAVVGNDLFVGGHFNQAGALPATGLARWNRAAEQWLQLPGSLGGVDDPEVRALAAAGQSLFVGGKFVSAGNTQANFVARLDPNTGAWSTIGDGVNNGVKWYNDRFTTVFSLAASPFGVFAGGDFDKAGGHSAPGFARWTGVAGTPNATVADGGNIEGENGVQMNIPAGALAEDAAMALAATAQPRHAAPQGQAALYAVHTAGTTLSGKTVDALSKPFILKLPYTDAQLAAAKIGDAATLTVARWNGAAWQPLLPCTGCSVDMAGKVVTLAADRMGEYVLLGTVTPGGGGDDGGGDDGGTTAQNVFLPMVKR